MQKERKVRHRRWMVAGVVFFGFLLAYAGVYLCEVVVEPHPLAPLQYVHMRYRHNHRLIGLLLLPARQAHSVVAPNLFFRQHPDIERIDDIMISGGPISAVSYWCLAVFYTIREELFP